MIESEKIDITKARENHRWCGTYRGVGWEIQRFHYSDSMPEFNPAWTLYLYIPLGQLPEEVREKFWLEPQPDDRGRVWYSYMGAPLVSDIDFHGGITYYEKYSGIDGSPRVVKIGCDYQHYGDEYCRPTIEYMARDVERAIDSFHLLVPTLLKRCSWCGEYNDTGTHPKCEEARAALRASLEKKE